MLSTTPRDDFLDVLASSIAETIVAGLRVVHAAVTYRDATQPRIGKMRVNGIIQEGAQWTMDIPDDKPFEISVEFDDKLGMATREPAPVSYTASNTGLVSITPSTMLDPSGAVVAAQNDQTATGMVTAGSGTFTLEADSADFKFASDTLNIVPGTAVSGKVTVTLAQVAPSPAPAPNPTPPAV